MLAGCVIERLIRQYSKQLRFLDTALEAAYLLYFYRFLLYIQSRDKRMSPFVSVINALDSKASDIAIVP